MKVDESNFRYLKNVEEITGYDYNIYWRDAENIDGYVSSETLFEMVKDLMLEITRYEEEQEEEYEFDEYTAWQDQQLEEGDL